MCILTYNKDENGQFVPTTKYSEEDMLKMISEVRDFKLTDIKITDRDVLEITSEGCKLWTEEEIKMLIGD